MKMMRRTRRRKSTRTRTRLAALANDDDDVRVVDVPLLPTLMPVWLYGECGVAGMARR